MLLSKQSSKLCTHTMHLTYYRNFFDHTTVLIGILLNLSDPVLVQIDIWIWHVNLRVYCCWVNGCCWDVNGCIKSRVFYTRKHKIFIKQDAYIINIDDDKFYESYFLTFIETLYSVLHCKLLFLNCWLNFGLCLLHTKCYVKNMVQNMQKYATKIIKSLVKAVY